MTDNLAEKLLKYPTAIGRFCIVIINNIYCIPTYVVWMGLLLPLKRLNPDAYYKIEGLLFHWLLAVVSMWSYTAGYNIVEVGDDVEECRMKKTLVIANHQSTADVPLLMANFNAKDGILPNIMWIMDRLFKYTNFGIVSIIHQDFFIASGKNKRDESIELLRKHVKNSFLKRNRKWMVLFPEGGFLRKRREVSQRYAKKNNLPFLQHVTLPRVGALKAIMDVMVQEASKVISSSSSACEQFENEFKKNFMLNNKNDNTICNKNTDIISPSSSKPLSPPLTSSSSSSSETITKFNPTIRKEYKFDDKIDSIITKRTPSSQIQTVTDENIISKEFIVNGEENQKNNNKPISDNQSTTTTTETTSTTATQIENDTLPNGNSSLTKNLINLLNKTITTNTTNNNPSNLNCTTNNNMNSANCLLEYILDITIAYPKAIPIDLPNIVHGMRRPCSTYMLYRLYKVSNIPKESEALTKWLYDRFVEKDQLLERFYKTGQFYLDRTMNNGQVIQQDVLRFFLINLFFITSTYFHYQMFTSLYTYGLYLTYGAS